MKRQTNDGMSQGTLKPSSSLPRLMRAYWKDVFWSWDWWLSLVIALSAGLFLRPKPSLLFELATVEVGVASALVGVILAGLAIMTAFLDARYVRVLTRSGDGVMPEVFHFKLTATVAVASIIFNLGLILVRDESWLSDYRALALALSVWLFSYALFCALNLIGLVGIHLALRETQVEHDLSDGQDTQPE